MNEVEIVVKSNDKTTMTQIGQRFKTELSRSVRGGVDDVDRTVTSRFKQIGEHAGTALTDGLRSGADAAGRQMSGFVAGSEEATLAVKKMGLAAKEAGDRAATAQRAAAEAAKNLAASEEEATAAARKAAEAEAALERGEIKAAEAKRLSADAARKQAAVERQRARATDASTKATRAAERAELAESAASETAARAIERQARAADKAAEKNRELARSAALAAAAQQLGTLKAAGRVKEYNALLGRTKNEFGDLGRTAVSKFKEIGEATSRSLVDKVRETSAIIKGPAVLGAIITAIQLLPTIASVAGGGMALALGGALAAVALKAQASTEDVRNSFSDLREHVAGELRRMSTPFHDTLLHMIDDARRGFDSLDLAAPFAKMAPALTKFSAQFANSLSRLNPAIESIGVAFSRVLGALGPHLGAIMNNIGTGIKAIMDGVAANPQGFAQFAESLSQIVRVGGDVIGFLAHFSTELNTAFEMANGFAAGPLGLLLVGMHKLASFGGGGNDAVAMLSKSMGGMSGAAGAAGDAMTGAGGATVELLSAQKAAAMTSDQLKAALDRLTGANQGAFDAQTQYRQALVAANTQAKANNAGIDGNSKAALANRQALSQLATTIKQNIENGHLSAAQIKTMRDNFIAAAEGMGVSKQRAKELADELVGVSGNMRKIPAKKHTDLTATNKTGGALKQADKGLTGFAKRTYRAALTATNKVRGAVSAATAGCLAFARRLYRAALTAVNRAAGAVAAATGLARRFARGTYRAALTAINRVKAAFDAAMRLGRSWAGRVFSATFNVIRKIIPGMAHGGIVGGGYAHGGIVGHAAEGGPRSNLTLVGEQGAELVRLPTGSTVIPHGQSMNMLGQAGGGGGPMHITLMIGKEALGEIIIDPLRKSIKSRGGKVQAVLGSG